MSKKVSKIKGINRAIKLLRMYSCLKAIDLAKQLGIAPGSLSVMESGQKEVSVDMITRYASLFGVERSFILMFAEKLEWEKSALEQEILKAVIKTIRSYKI